MTRILCPVLVGREDELAQLTAAARAASAGTGGVLVVSGPAGIGKSRLLLELGGAAAALGMTVVGGRCVEARTPVSFRPLTEALLAAFPAGPPPDAWLGGFERGLAPVVPAWASGAAGAQPSPVVIAEAVLRALSRAGGATGTLVVLEDLHWADPETMLVLEYLADHATQTRVLFAVSIRMAEAAPDVARVIERLAQRRAVHVTSLDPMAADAVHEIAQRALGTAVLPAAIVSVLDANAEGIPFLAEELLAAAVATGALVHAGGGWSVQGPVERLVPQSFVTLMRARTDALGSTGRRFLGAAALLGRTFDWRVAAAAAGCGDDEAHVLLQRGLERQIIAPQHDAYAFRHALTRDAIATDLLPHERIALARACLRAMAADASLAGAGIIVAADLAEAAGERDTAATHLLRAARDALDRSSIGTALAATRRAAALAESAALRADILETMADASAAAGDLRATQTTADELLRLLGEVDEDPVRIARCHIRVARCAAGAAHFDVAAREIEGARRAARGATPGALSAELGALEANIALGSGRVGDAERIALLAAGAPQASPDVVCEALEVAARCARTRNLDEADEIASRAVRVAERAHLPLWRMRAMYQRAVAAMFRTGDDALLRQTRREAERLGAMATVATLDLEIAAALEVQFRRDEVLAACDRCIELATLLDVPAIAAVAHLFVAVVAATRGDRAAMEAAIRDVVSLSDDAELRAAVEGDARAIASLVEEDRVRARRELDSAAALMRDPNPAFPRISAALRALLMAVDSETPDFTAAAGSTEMHSQSAGYLAWARAVMLGRDGMRDEAATAATRAQELLGTAPFYAALTRRLAAEAALRDGWGEPVPWLTESGAFFAQHGHDRLVSACRALLRHAGARVPRDLRAARALPDGLRRAGVTPREAEVLALVAEGLTNHDIAARLHLSERTVEQHVAVLRQKLQARTRAQLAVMAAAEVPAPS